MGKFIKWIHQAGGVEVLSRKVGVTQTCVKNWARGTVTPSTAVAVRLVRMGRGAFDHNDIVRETYRPLPKR